jgi:hypothetical protein
MNYLYDLFNLFNTLAPTHTGHDYRINGFDFPQGPDPDPDHYFCWSFCSKAYYVELKDRHRFVLYLEQLFIQKVNIGKRKATIGSSQKRFGSDRIRIRNNRFRTKLRIYNGFDEGWHQNFREIVNKQLTVLQCSSHSLTKFSFVELVYCILGWLFYFTITATCQDICGFSRVDIETIWQKYPWELLHTFQKVNANRRKKCFDPVPALYLVTIFWVIHYRGVETFFLQYGLNGYQKTQNFT